MSQIFSSLGAVYDESEPGNFPVHFGDWHGEYEAACNAAAICDCSAMSKVELRGRDRTKFLNNLCTNDIKRLGTGAGCEAYFTSAQGKILFFVRVFADGESLWIDTVPSAAQALLAHLDRYRIMEQVEFADRSAEYAQLLVLGPRALDCITAATGAPVPQLADLGHCAITLAGNSCSLTGHATLVRPTFELRVPAANVAAVWQDLWRAGQPLGMRPMGTAAFQTIRVEAGWPLYGRDIDQSNLPQEVGRTARTVSFTKGCYLGQETVARIDALGHVNRHFIGLTIPSESEPPTPVASVVSAGKNVGQITSSAYSPTLGHAIALGYVRRGHEQPGVQLAIDCQGRTVLAKASALPFGTAKK
jgi:folate-binding protein YgfZ